MLAPQAYADSRPAVPELKDDRPPGLKDADRPPSRGKGPSHGKGYGKSKSGKNGRGSGMGFPPGIAGGAEKGGWAQSDGPSYSLFGEGGKSGLGLLTSQDMQRMQGMLGLQAMAGLLPSSNGAGLGDRRQRANSAAARSTAPGSGSASAAAAGAAATLANGARGGHGAGAKGKGRGLPHLAMVAASAGLLSEQWMYSGVVTFFNSDRKSGFISCDDIGFMTGQDVYVFKDVLETGKAGVGDTVCFRLHWSPRGQPQASAPLLRLAALSGFALVGVFRAGNFSEKGFGFIDCPDTKAVFGRDVYVNKDLAMNLVVGKPVAFNAYLNRDGLPNASSAQVVEDSFEPVPGDLSGSTPAPGLEGKGIKGIMKGGKFDGKGWSSSPGGAVGRGGPPQATGERYTGVLKSFNQQSNYGFISCEQVFQRYGRDVFVHGKQLTQALAEVRVGSHVTFVLALNQQGQPQAVEVSPTELVGTALGDEPDLSVPADPGMADPLPKGLCDG